MSNLVCVVYLARVGNPLQLLESFIRSYQSNIAGIDHKLLLVFKGFNIDSTELALSKQLLKNIEYTQFDISDDGLDITAYQKVLSNPSFSHFERFCFSTLIQTYAQMIGCLNSITHLIKKCWPSRSYRIFLFFFFRSYKSTTKITPT